MAIEVVGNIWSYPADAICVTTNGVLKSDGSLVMGAGIAKQARDKFSSLDILFGIGVKNSGNHVQHCLVNGESIVSFPTKNHWRDPSDLNLIIRSRDELLSLADTQDWKTVVLPRPGCGLGGLDWEKEVKEVIIPFLDDRFHIITPK